MTPKGPAPSTGQRQGAKEITELRAVRRISRVIPREMTLKALNRSNREGFMFLKHQLAAFFSVYFSAPGLSCDAACGT